jgi:Carboxypeptidase regulatory-like domain/TonB dependent receptor
MSATLARVARIAIVLTALILAIPVRSQDASTGAIRGTVLDPDGRPIAAATVAVVSTGTGAPRSALTDADGRFSFELLPPGDYSGRAEIKGMSPQVTPQIHVDVGGSLELQFRLSLAGASETVTVSGAPPLVETVPSSVSTVVDERAINELPLNGRRFTDLSLLAPGVTQDPRGLTSASNGDLAFGGIRGYQSSYLVDGADNNNAFFSQARGRYRAPYQFSNEVVQEFRVSSNTYGAELGRAGGAVVNVVTKSGSNHLHGTGFYFVRDSTFGAQPAFLSFKPKDRQHQFGGTLGGPIRSNRVFFFAGYDQHIFHVPTVVNFLSGGSVLVPQAGAGPLEAGDYEDNDKTQVFAAAAQLNQLTGNYRADLLGNTAFFKLDATLTARQHLSARLNSSRYYGTNNVFFDPASPVTNSALSDNGEENVSTESASIALTSALSTRLVSHLRAQFSRDLQSSNANSADPRTHITNVLDGIGRSTILPRETREHRLHLAETLSVEQGRHSWKFGGDLLTSWIYNFFPSMFGGEYYYDTISVDPWTFEPMRYGLKLTPLRAYAHQVARYYIQNFGSAVSHPDTNEYAAFIQDTVRVTGRLALSLGARYDLQTFATKNLVTNPLWPMSGKVPLQDRNVSPRIGLAYSIGHDRPLVIRAGYGLFYTRIPQIYTSTIANDNGLTSANLILDNTNYYEHRVFPAYPSVLATCALKSTFCAPPASVASYLSADVAAFAPNFVTPRVHQASLNLERELAERFAGGISYMYVHGQNLIRARDVNLPAPVDVTYPVYDDSGINFLGAYYDIPSFSTWQITRSMTCPFPPCINPLARPISQLGAINQFDSAASSVYQGLTVSLHRRMTSGLYFRMAYTFAHSYDDGQDALVAGRPVTVQNSYSTAAERGPSATDQRHRFVLSAIEAPTPFGRDHALLSKLFNDWKIAGVLTIGSGRPVDAKVFGDPNRDGNSFNDRLPGYGRNAFLGPDYATTDLRLTRRLYLRPRLKLELVAEAFNALNRDNQRVRITDDGFTNTATDFIQLDKTIGIRYFPAYYQRPGNLMKATSAYAPRQIQFAVKVIF